MPIPKLCAEDLIQKGYQVQSEDPDNRWVLLKWKEGGEFRVCNLSDRNGHPCGHKSKKKNSIRTHVENYPHTPFFFNHKPTGGNKRV
jgi:hypothetical protein